MIKIPTNALVLLVGPAGCGKSTFARNHFRPAEIVASDEFRERVSDDMTNQKCNDWVFEVVHKLIEARLAMGRLTVLDATSLTPEARKAAKEIADRFSAPTYVLMMDTTIEQCLRQNAARDRVVPEAVIQKHWERYQQAMVDIPNEGYAFSGFLSDDIQIGDIELVKAAGWDVIGDIHGCYNEFWDLLLALGYKLIVPTTYTGDPWIRAEHQEGRKLAFVGDYGDRGPESIRVLVLIRQLVLGGHIAIRGNHDDKLARALAGNKVKLSHGLEKTMQEFKRQLGPSDRGILGRWVSALPHYARLGFTMSQLPGNPTEIVVSHAGIPRMSVGRTDKATLKQSLYGEVTGFQNGFPVRGTEWTKTWNKPEMLCVYGHTPVDEPTRSNNTINIDTGCVFGGYLTALRLPENRCVQMKAFETYSVREISKHEEDGPLELNMSPFEVTVQ